MFIFGWRFGGPPIALVAGNRLSAKLDKGYALETGLLSQFRNPVELMLPVPRR